ncbi:MAG TPA: carboxymuconolactone decarboxylase family protein [Gemmatimonadaceae bacterium]|jgi:AhpD family alkylhydroperoxidase|nr:carboxymuconolactone decarboxylase family protein [Gemmatimonadaceae bacterium]
MPTARVPYRVRAPEGIAALETLDAYIDTTGLAPTLLDLVRLRASLINGCAFCIDMHTKDLFARGESVERIAGLSAWEPTPFYSDRERAALTWCDAVTTVADAHVSDAVFEAVRPHFADKELVDLTLAIIAINSWNRMAVAFRLTPGAYRSTATAS